MNVDFAKEDYGIEEKEAVMNLLERGWLASGEENIAFEKEFAEFIGVRDAIFVSSGSMANLMALHALNLKKGAKVLTSACGFPTTLAPILHLGLEPVLVDYDLNTLNPNINQVEDKINGVSAVMLAHTLGSPFGVERLLKYDVPIIEDCCEAVGSAVNGRYVGAFGKAGTFSFYPAHQITALGGGGMITTNDLDYAREIRSLRDWGKVWNWDTKLGNNVTVFDFKVDGLPYYPGYSYQTLGYNAKMPEANAAFGRVQLKKLTKFSIRRFENYCRLTLLFDDFKCFVKSGLIRGALPSSFGFPIVLKIKELGLRDELVNFLERSGIRTRPFFAGNITRHKPFQHLKQDFPVADHLMWHGLFVGCWQGLSDIHLQYIADTVKLWMKSRSLS